MELANYKIMKVKEKFIKNMTIDFNGDVNEFKVTDDVLEAVKVDESSEAWLNFLEKNKKDGFIDVIQVSLIQQ